MDESDYRFRNAIQVVLDLASLKAIWMITIQARVLLNPLFGSRVKLDDIWLWSPPTALIVVFWMLTSYRFRLYRVCEGARFWRVQVSAFENAVALTIITALITFFSQRFGELSVRLFIPLLLPVSFAVLSLSRYVGTILTPLVRRFVDAPARVALVGDWEKGSQIIEGMKATRSNPFRGLIVPECDLIYASASATPVLGSTRQIAELINRERLDRVIVLNTSLTNDELAYCSRILKRMQVPVGCAVESCPGPVNVEVSTVDGLPFLESVPVEFTRQQELIKRIFDVTLAAASLVVLMPILVAIGIAIKIDSKGPVLYKSPRIGKGGRHFTFLKFRSMYVDNKREAVAACNEKNGHIFKIRNDPRVTPIGRFIRRYSLDELPQLINILRGEMSIVGPRPLPACDLGPDGMSKKYAAWSEGRSIVPPGLTGLWQVSGRSDLAFEEMVRLDLSYIQNWSLALDVKIILDTPMLVLRGAGAY